MSKVKLYQAIARKLVAMENCDKSGNVEWYVNHQNSAVKLTSLYMPSGSGIDSGCTLLIDECKPDKLVFSCDYHHMNEGGYYDGWSEHRVIVTPSLSFDIDIKITGRNRDDIKEYLHEVLHDALMTEVEEFPTD